MKNIPLNWVFLMLLVLIRTAVADEAYKTESSEPESTVLLTGHLGEQQYTVIKKIYPYIYDSFPEQDEFIDVIFTFDSNEKAKNFLQGHTRNTISPTEEKLAKLLNLFDSAYNDDTFSCLEQAKESGRLSTSFQREATPTDSQQETTVIPAIVPECQNEPLPTTNSYYGAPKLCNFYRSALKRKIIEPDDLRNTEMSKKSACETVLDDSWHLGWNGINDGTISDDELIVFYDNNSSTLEVDQLISDLQERLSPENIEELDTLRDKLKDHLTAIKQEQEYKSR
ncbi:hypothetical protein EOPP23_16005 [Endozoicomonas sp. OPT23]|uniref:hypothetical protein n=1 Tax=Endozoicomonas sp. OPT23 TaxID=2072845 RepID=UPI00129B4C9B|nr:hypothetical protein [Endozoicomonas sp. OPT23]MRI34491.1 hypothetical protein [Endozoicomonas sp. OPT23]